MNKDLSVELRSPALKDKKIDLIICGSIAASESVKFIRELRRLGASLRVIPTRSALSFVTKLALEWALGSEIETDFSAKASHISEGDLLVVAPATSDFIAKASQGHCDSLALSLFSSSLGQNKKIFLHPCMHESLSLSPLYKNFEKILEKKANLKIYKSSQEEAKLKFAKANILASEVAHFCNDLQKTIALGMGGTRSYLDTVRFIGNNSSGELGKLIAETLYEFGFSTTLVLGDCKCRPEFYSSLLEDSDPEAMEKNWQSLEGRYHGAIMLAAVSDYIAEKKEKEKIASSREHLKIDLIRFGKILRHIKVTENFFVGFKQADSISSFGKEDYFSYKNKYKLSHQVVNQSNDPYKAKVFKEKSEKVENFSTKLDLAHYLGKEALSYLK